MIYVQPTFDWLILAEQNGLLEPFAGENATSILTSVLIVFFYYGIILNVIGCHTCINHWLLFHNGKERRDYTVLFVAVGYVGLIKFTRYSGVLESLHDVISAYYNPVFRQRSIYAVLLSWVKCQTASMNISYEAHHDVEKGTHKNKVTLMINIPKNTISLTVFRKFCCRVSIHNICTKCNVISVFQ